QSVVGRERRVRPRQAAKGRAEPVVTELCPQVGRQRGVGLRGGQSQRALRRLTGFPQPGRLGIGGGQSAEHGGVISARQFVRSFRQFDRAGTVAQGSVGGGCEQPRQTNLRVGVVRLEPQRLV